MSSASGNAAGSSAVPDVFGDAKSVRSVVRRSVLAPLRFLAFWTAVLLPLAYLPLVHGGLTGGETTILAALAVANLAAVVVGHGHRTNA